MRYSLDAARPMAQGLLVPMDVSICASCGLQLAGDSALCPHHHCVFGDDWAEGNRLMCDFFHRGKVPPRLAGDEQEDDLWPQFDEATSEPFSETPLVSRRGLEPRTPC